jgi:ferredoxin
MNDEERRVCRRLRLAVRLLVLAAAMVLLLPAIGWPPAPLLVPALSPYVAAGAAIAARSVGAVTLLGLPVLLIVLVRRRWFCRWACPVGLITEHVARVSPVPKSWCQRVPPLGRWIALATLAGACAGYPVLLWMDPLALLSGVFGPWNGPLDAAMLLPAVGLPAVLLLTLLLPNAWCRRVCPLGATQDLLILPQLLVSRQGSMDRFGCHWRSASAEELHGQDARGTSPSPPIARRTALAVGVSCVWAGVGVLSARRLLATAPADAAAPLRPPGAVAPPKFAGLCIRCGNCVRACPAGIIRADLGEHGVAEFLVPVVRFDEDYCREGCRRCTEVCPSGAIRSLRGQGKQEAPIGLAQVDMDLCWLADDRECNVCARSCPFDAITFGWSKATYSRTPQVDPARCPGCGACQVACPGTNEWERQSAESPAPLRKAIRVVPRAAS